MTAALGVMEPVTFEMDPLQFNRIATLSMPASYFERLTMVLSSLVGLAVVHTGFVVPGRMGKSKAQIPSLIRALSPLLMAFFFISLSASFLAPSSL